MFLFSPFTESFSLTDKYARSNPQMCGDNVVANSADSTILSTGLPHRDHGASGMPYPKRPTGHT